MNHELKRWDEDAPDDYVRAKGAYAGLAPHAEELERMLARVELAVQLPATPAPPRLSARTWLWLVSSVGLVGLALFFAAVAPRADSAVPVLARHKPAADSGLPASADREPAASSMAPALSTPVMPNRVEPEATSASAAAPPAPRRMPSLAPSDPLAELALLERARRVMATNPARALALSEEHRQKYRAGQFAEERELLAVEALVGLGQTEAAARRAGSFLRAHPNSVHAHRLEVILQRDAP